MGDQLTPIRFMRKVVFHQLKALNEEESDNVAGDFPRFGNRCGGIGCVRISDTGDAFWAIVECNAIELKRCPRHPRVEMSLYKTAHKTHFNVDAAVFMRCDVELEVAANGSGNSTCGYNIYPVYPYAKIQAERALHDEEAMKPVLFKFEEKFEMEQRMRGIIADQSCANDEI